MLSLLCRGLFALLFLPAVFMLASCATTQKQKTGITVADVIAKNRYPEALRMSGKLKIDGSSNGGMNRISIAVVGGKRYRLSLTGQLGATLMVAVSGKTTAGYMLPSENIRELWHHSQNKLIKIGGLQLKADDLARFIYPAIRDGDVPPSARLESGKLSFVKGGVAYSYLVSPAGIIYGGTLHRSGVAELQFSYEWLQDASLVVGMGRNITFHFSKIKLGGKISKKLFLLPRK